MFKSKSQKPGVRKALVIGGVVLAVLWSCRSRSLQPPREREGLGGDSADQMTFPNEGMDSTGVGSTVCQNGEVRCDGASLQSCADDGTGFLTLQICDSAALCQTEPASCASSTCIADEMTCQEEALQVCNADLTGFELFATCQSAAHCSSSERRCLEEPCEGGALRCNRQQDGVAALERCNDAQADWDRVEACTTRQLCDLTIAGTRRISVQGEGPLERSPDPSETVTCMAAACQAGQVECQGANLAVCNAGLTALDVVEECASASLCQLSLDANSNGVQAPSCIAAVCEAGTYRCTQAGALEICEDNRTGFRVIQQCIGAPFCDAASGACNDAPCEAGSESCNSDQPQRCRDDQTGFDTLGEPCLNAALCNDQGQSAVCDTPACSRGELSSNEFRCDGANLLRCNDTFTGYDPLETCVTADLCQSDSGTCRAAVCEVDENSCEGGTLQVCNAGRTGFDNVENCGDASQCDAAAGACTDPCEPGTARCTPQGEIEQCADRLAGWQVTADCLTASLCDEATLTCIPPTCQRGERRCDNEGEQTAIQQCAPGRDQFDTLANCQANELCDSQNAECDICDPGSLHCEGDILVTCSDNGQNESQQQCGSGLCDASAGRCLVCDAIGSARCQGTQLFVCVQGNQGEVERAEFCQTGELCQQTLEECGQNGESCQCNEGECGPGEVRCSGNTLEQCNAGRTGFSFLETCGNGLCNSQDDRCDDCSGNVSACIDGNTRQFCRNGLFQVQNCTSGNICDGGQCVTPVCNLGDFSCSGNTLQQCNSSRTGLDFVDNCGAGLCNAGGGRCDQCAANEASCVDGDTLRFCNNGFSQTRNCGNNQICQNAQCVQATCNQGDRICTGNLDLQQCNAQRTGFEVISRCTGGGCNAAGTGCNACFDQEQPACSAPNERRLCRGGQIVFESCGTGRRCDNGRCISQVCTPNQLLCQQGTQRRCNAQGSAATTLARCSGNVGRRCNGTTPVTTTCTGNQTCNPQNGICQAPQRVCNPNATRCLDSVRVEQCLPDGSGFEVSRACTGTGCNAATGDCAECVPQLDPPRCDGNTRVTCENGIIQTNTCPVGTLCQRNGQCDADVRFQ